jgi:hypothetical protein
MKVCDCTSGAIIYSVWVPVFEIAKPNYQIKKMVVVLPEHNIVRMMHNGLINEKTIQENNDIFVSESEALIYISNELQKNLNRITEEYNAEIEKLLKQAVTHIEEAI